MGSIGGYFREHPWQRRSLTVLVTMTLGALAGVLLYPHVGDYLLIRDLGSENPKVRTEAISRAVAAAAGSTRTLRRLDEALSGPDERRFTAIVAVLRRLGRFDVPNRDPLQLDRMCVIELATTHSVRDPGSAARTRGVLLGELILSGRDNRYVRRGLAVAAGDDDAEVRAGASVLAAILADDATLKALLADASAEVSASAALAAGLAMRSGLRETISELLGSHADAQVISACAYALATLSPAESSARLCELLKRTDDALRERLLWVMTILNDAAARRAVGGVIASSVGEGKHPSATALLAAGKLKLAAAGPAVRAVLADVTTEGMTLRTAQVAAALAAADRLALPVRDELDAICRKLWSPDFPLVLSTAAMLLGKQAEAAQPDRPGAVSRSDAVETLRLAAAYSAEPASQPSGGSGGYVTTPLASAAAAVALWRIAPAVSELKQPATRTAGDSLWLWDIDRSSSAFHIRLTVGQTRTHPGDYIAWHVGLSGRGEAFELGMTMLPPLGAPAGLRVYSNNERSAGAMLLALAARTPQQKQAVIERIRSRLTGASGIGERDFFVGGSYRCALLMLGCGEQREAVSDLLATRSFPRRRAITALCAAGDRKGLDWMLLNRRLSDEDVAFLLADLGIGEVVAATAPPPDLPVVDPAAPQDVLGWQVRILRAAYAIRRSGLHLGLRR